jgi:hypothetical protein
VGSSRKMMVSFMKKEGKYITRLHDLNKTASVKEFKRDLAILEKWSSYGSIAGAIKAITSLIKQIEKE